MSNTKLKSLATNVGLLVASTILSLLLAEWSVRTWYPQQLAVWHTTEDGLVIHPPGLTTYLAEFKREVRFNAIGMRDREHTKEKRQDTTRVLVLGDSYMEALQVAFEDSFPSLLESGLREALHRNVEVINGAVSGWGQDDQLVYLEKYGRAFEPDLILVAMTLHNDVLDNMEQQFYTLANGKLVRKPAVRVPASELRILRVKGFFASRSHLWQLARKWKRLGEMRNAATALNHHVTQLIRTDEETEELKRGWKLTFELFKGIREAGKNMGAETAIMLIPLRLQLQDDRLPGTSMDDVATERPQQAMRTFGLEANIEIIDLLPTLRRWTVENGTPASRASLHLAEGHWNEKGHRLAADAAVKEIVERRLIKVGSSISSSGPPGKMTLNRWSFTLRSRTK